MKKRNKCKTGMKRCVLLFMLLFVMGGYAQNGQQVVFNGVSAEKIEVSVTQEDLVAIEPERLGEGVAEDGLISLNVRGVELRNVIRIFTELSGANIIIPELPPELAEAKIDVNLSNVQWRPALQAVLSTLELELFEQIPGSEVYSVRRRAADAPEPMQVQTFRLNHASVGLVADLIKSMIPEPGKVSVFPARNTLVVQSTAEKMLETKKMIEAVDLPRQQVFIEAKFLELADSAAERIGIDWQVLQGYRVGVSDIGGEVDFQRSRSAQVNRMYDMRGNQFEDYSWIDRPETTIISYDNNPVYALPPWINPATATPSDYVRIGAEPSVTEVPAGADRLVGTPTRTRDSSRTLQSALGARLSASEFNLVLAALREAEGSKIVSNPRIIVANEETATIHIGRRMPNIRGTTQTAGDSQVVTTYQLDQDEPYFEDGIRINVTPTVNTADNITVRIQPTLDRLDAIPFFAPDGTPFYGKSTKTIETLFSLENGQTAAIGGLTQNSSDSVERKVPILGNIPLIGRFFSFKAKDDLQNETIIFVTVGLANPENIDMDTGMPQETVLALRHDAQMRADREIRSEELRIFREHQAARAAAAVQALRDAETAAADAQIEADAVE